MKARRIIIVGAGAILALGATLASLQGPHPCEAHPAGLSADGARLVGTASCRDGSARIEFEDASTVVPIRNGLWSAQVIRKDGSVVGLQGIDH